MTPNALYVIGGPGSGKSTLMAGLLDGWEAEHPFIRLVPKELFGHRLEHPVLGSGIYLGKIRPEFPGTDALARSVSPHATQWATEVLPTERLSWVFGEGVRLSHLKFFEDLHQHTRLTVIYLALDESVSQQRRIDRGLAPIEERWCRSSFSRARNLAAKCPAAGIRLTTLDAEKSVPDLVAEVWHSVLA